MSPSSTSLYKDGTNLMLLIKEFITYSCYQRKGSFHISIRMVHSTICQTIVTTSNLSKKAQKSWLSATWNFLHILKNIVQILKNGKKKLVQHYDRVITSTTSIWSQGTMRHIGNNHSSFSYYHLMLEPGQLGQKLS